MMMMMMMMVVVMVVVAMMMMVVVMVMVVVAMLVAAVMMVVVVVMMMMMMMMTMCVCCRAAKEIHMKHQAPVISVCVIDRCAVPLPAPFEVENECARPPDMSGGHAVVICSEEQLKVVDTLVISLSLVESGVV